MSDDGFVVVAAARLLGAAQETVDQFVVICRQLQDDVQFLPAPAPMYFVASMPSGVPPFSTAAGSVAYALPQAGAALCAASSASSTSAAARDTS